MNFTATDLWNYFTANITYALLIGCSFTILFRIIRGLFK